MPAEWLDEDALVFRQKEAFLKETARRETLDREGGTDDHLPPLCLITHFYCSKTKMLMPIHAIDEHGHQVSSSYTLTLAAAATIPKQQQQRQQAQQQKPHETPGVGV